MKNRFYYILTIALLALLLCGCETIVYDSPAPQGSASLDITEEISDFTIYFLDVGQADCALILSGGYSMLIDGGNVADSDLVYAFLQEKGIDHLDHIICTHAHEDHVGGLSAALRASSAGAVYSPVESYGSAAFENFKAAVDEQGLTLSLPLPQDSFALGDAEVIVLGPVFDYENTNNTSIVVKIIYGETSFLFTGDIEREAELDLIDSGADLSCDVLKVPHHGSSTSSSYVFLYEAAPSYGIISCGMGNSYGHPHEDVLSRYRDADVLLYRTDMQGTITCTSDGKTISFAVEKNEGSVTNPTEETEVLYIGNINSKKLHLQSCTSLPAEHNRVTFYNLEAAYSEGYENCGSCMR